MWIPQEQPQRDITATAMAHAWPVIRRAAELFWVTVMFLLGQVLIWTLHLALKPVGLDFLSSICGMVLVFVTMEILNRLCHDLSRIYKDHVKPKVDFLNRNMGLGFPIPLVAIDHDDYLESRGIGRLIGVFVTTNVIFWVSVFALALGFNACIMALIRTARIRSAPASAPLAEHQAIWLSGETCRISFPAPIFPRWPSDATTLRSMASAYKTNKEAAMCTHSRASSAYSSDSDGLTSIPRVKQGMVLQQEVPPSTSSGTCFADVAIICPIFLSILFIFAVGMPVSFVTGDHRVLDGCTLWFVWITSCRLQRGLASMAFRPGPYINSSAHRGAMTLLNPVLLTTLTMTAYTRARSAATATPLHDVLDSFSSGTSLSELWSHLVSPASYPLKPQHEAFFGAGDAALAFLEVGIVVWGFKLHECRLQLASSAGVSVILVSGITAAFNVFISTLIGKGFGLAAPEALAFATRSTTLALARPAVAALGGNQVVNAALVVSNGILGQLLYPFVLRRLRPLFDGFQAEPIADDDATPIKDDNHVVATGTTIGINGGAMGVAYLHECKSRAAPYAALSMTVFGVMTVVFSAVEPFTATLRALVAL